MQVSVITPCFNSAAYLEQTLQSVLAQQGDFDLEYLVIDGGSTDGSLDIIERYRGRLARVVSEPDHGPSSAINKGLHLARGEIIAWLSALRSSP